MKKRRFTRIKFEEQCVLEYGVRSFPGRLLNISLKGALVEFLQDIGFRRGDLWHLSFHLGNPDFIMRFGVEVVHTADNLAGFRFGEVDLNTMFHLRNLLEARIGDPGRVRGELDCLLADEQFQSSPPAGQVDFPESESYSSS